MPIVDAYADLGSAETGVSMYLAQAHDTHVLRMIAMSVLHPLEQSVNELNLLRQQSVTPGLGGFPNAIVARCDITDGSALQTLMMNVGMENLRGVHQIFEQPLSKVPTNEAAYSPDNASLAASFDLLEARRLSLDVTANIDHLDRIAAWAVARPDIVIIVNLELSTVKADKEKATQLTNQLQVLATPANVALKILGSGLGLAELESQLHSVMSVALPLFGDDRLLFGSGSLVKQGSTQQVRDTSETCASFDEIWQVYTTWCNQYSARVRDKLLRSNAIRLYRI